MHDLPENSTAPLESQQPPTAKSGLRFGLRQLFYVTSVVAAAIALMGIGGLVWAGLVCLVWAKFFSDQRKKPTPTSPPPQTSRTTDWKRSTGPAGFTWVELLIVLAVIGILIGMMLPAVRRMSPRMMERMQTRNAMKQVLLAMHNYESAHGHLPPAYLTDEHGKPIHSWRVLLLPYLEHQAIFDKYDFDEPWDGPNNKKLVDQIDPSVFIGYVRNRDKTDFRTGFKLVTGPGSAFVEDQTLALAQISAGTSNTIGLVNDRSQPVCWMAPEDISIDQAVELFDIEKKPTAMAHVRETKFSKITSYQSSLAMLDGSTHRVAPLENAQSTREYFTVAQNPVVDWDSIDFEYSKSTTEFKPEGYFLLAINGLLAILPAFWIPRRSSKPN